jgi:rubrerythrin
LESVPRPRKSIEEDQWRIPASRGLIDRDLKQVFQCFMCGRPAPTGVKPPQRCPACSGNLLLVEDYEPRYG